MYKDTIQISVVSQNFIFFKHLNINGNDKTNIIVIVAIIMFCASLAIFIIYNENILCRFIMLSYNQPHMGFVSMWT